MLTSVLEEAPLLAEFNSNTTIGIAPLKINFSDVSKGSIIRRKWNFGDNTPLTLLTRNPVHTFSSPGIYNVILTVSDINKQVASSILEINVLTPGSAIPKIKKTIDRNISKNKYTSLKSIKKVIHVPIPLETQTLKDGAPRERKHTPKDEKKRTFETPMRTLGVVTRPSERPGTTKERKIVGPEVPNPLVQEKEELIIEKVPGPKIQPIVSHSNPAPGPIARGNPKVLANLKPFTAKTKKTALINIF